MQLFRYYLFNIIVWNSLVFYVFWNGLKTSSWSFSSWILNRLLRLYGRSERTIGIDLKHTFDELNWSVLCLVYASPFGWFLSCQTCRITERWILRTFFSSCEVLRNIYSESVNLIHFAFPRKACDCAPSQKSSVFVEYDWPLMKDLSWKTITFCLFISPFVTSLAKLTPNKTCPPLNWTFISARPA